MSEPLREALPRLRGYPVVCDDKDGGSVGWSADPLGAYVRWTDIAALATPDTLDVERQRLIAAALHYYADTMPGYAAAAGLSRDEYAAVMVDVKRARAEYDRLAREGSGS
jgi:hypothetical protein